MGLFNKLKGLLIEEEELKPSDAVIPAPAPVAEAPVKKTVYTKTNQPKPVLDQKIIDTIMSQINDKGPDYNTFVELLNSMEGVIPDEGTRFNAAFIAAKKSNKLTQKKILDAIAEKVEALLIEQKEFDNTIGDASIDIKTMEKELGIRDNTIYGLESQIDSLKKEKASIAAEIAAKDTETKTLGTNFIAAMEFINQDLVNFKNKVETYLKGGK